MVSKNVLLYKKAKKMTQQYIQLNTRVKEIQQLDPRQTQRRTIKEESKIANHDWVDHQVCSMLQY